MKRAWLIMCLLLPGPAAAAGMDRDGFLCYSSLYEKGCGISCRTPLLNGEAAQLGENQALTKSYIAGLNLLALDELYRSSYCPD